MEDAVIQALALSLALTLFCDIDRHSKFLCANKTKITTSFSNPFKYVAKRSQGNILRSCEVPISVDS